MDRVTRYLGILMIILVLYVAATSGPPVGSSGETVAPEFQCINLPIITLIGGTVGVYHFLRRPSAD